MKLSEVIKDVDFSEIEVDISPEELANLIKNSKSKVKVTKAIDRFSNAKTQHKIIFALQNYKIMVEAESELRRTFSTSMQEKYSFFIDTKSFLNLISSYYVDLDADQVYDMFISPSALKEFPNKRLAWIYNTDGYREPTKDDQYNFCAFIPDRIEDVIFNGYSKFSPEEKTLQLNYLFAKLIEINGGPLNAHD